MNLSPIETEILRGYNGGGWQVAALLLDVDEGISHAKSGASGCSGFPSAGRTWWMQTTARGIELREALTSAEPTHVLTWTVVRAFARSVPDDLHAVLRERTAAISRHMAQYRVHPNGSHQPYRQMGPVTPEYAKACEEWDAWHLTYRAERRRLEALRGESIDACFEHREVEQLDMFGALL